MNTHGANPRARKPGSLKEERAHAAVMGFRATPPSDKTPYVFRTTHGFTVGDLVPYLPNQQTLRRNLSSQVVSLGAPRSESTRPHSSYTTNRSELVGGPSNA